MPEAGIQGWARHRFARGLYGTYQFSGLVQVRHSMSGCGQILTQVRPALIEYLSVLWARTSQALYVWLWSNTDTSSSRAHRVPVSSLGSYKSGTLCLAVVKY